MVAAAFWALPPVGLLLAGGKVVLSYAQRQEHVLGAHVRHRIRGRRRIRGVNVRDMYENTALDLSEEG